MVTDHENERLRGLVLKQRAIIAILVQALREIEKTSRDLATINEAHKVINATLVTIADGDMAFAPQEQRSAE